MYFLLIYLIIIAIVSYLVETKKIPPAFTNNAVVYSLSFSVLMTGWSYYGNVEKAAFNDLSFVAPQVGITFSSLFWWFVIRKLVRIKEKFRINSISDFLSLRYGKSQTVGIIASLICCILIIPYIALQWNAIFSSLKVVSNISPWLELLTVFLTAGFIVHLGIRKLDPTEHHRGIIFVIAVEGILKLLALLLVNWIIVFKINRGPSEFFEKVNLILPKEFPMHTNFYTHWMTLVILTIWATMFLPRQFHVAVVENQKEDHIKTAMWVFPLYALLLIFSAFPIAWQGIIKELSLKNAKDFPILIPLKYGYPSVALIAFIGGLSACFGMIILSTITVTTMLSNHIVYPMFSLVTTVIKTNRYLLYIRWIIAGIILFISYCFFRFFTYSHMLITTGILAFTAIFQFLPAIIGGLFWKRGNKLGAITGIISGFIVWIFIILIPYMVKFGESGSDYFSLFGRFDPIFQGTFISFFINCSFYILVSLITSQNVLEAKIANEVVDVGSYHEIGLLKDKSVIILEEKIPVLVKNLSKILSKEKAESLVKDVCQKVAKDRNIIGILEFQSIVNQLEKRISGIVGSATAHKLMVNTKLYSESERELLGTLYSKMMAEINLPLGELRRRIDYYQEKERLLKKHADELSRLIKALSEEKLKLSAIIEAMGDGIVCCDKKGRVVLTNEIARNLLGDILNKKNLHVYEVILQFEDSQDLLKLYHLKKSSKSVETRLNQGDKKLDVEVKVIAVLDENKYIAGKVVAIKDITLEKMAEEEMIKAEKLSSLGVIAGGIAHDFNNLLTAVSGNLELAMYMEDTYRIKENLKKTLNAVNKAKGLTRQLITFSKGGAPVKELVSLKELIFDVVPFALSGSNISPKFLIQDDLWIVSADKDQISQVIQNLTINAKDAMPRGGILIVKAENIVLDQHPYLDPGPYIKLSFQDNGPGIPSKDLTRIFDPYFTTKKGGTGLGLAVCYSVIKQHKGLIDVESREGQGACFYIFLPAVTHRERQEKERIEDILSISLQKAKGKVLILEDEEEIRNLLIDFLNMLDFDVDGVEKGEDALLYYKRALEKGTPYQAVIMDLTITSGMGGEECIKHIKRIDPQVKAIVMSGYSDDPIMSRYESYGFRGRLKKPFSLTDLKREIEKLLGDS